MHRRTLLALAGTGAIPLAGCTGDDPEEAGGGTTPTTDAGDGTTVPDDGTATPGDGTTTTRPDRDTLPENCPVSQHLDVEWPTDLDAETVASFVESYEAAYYRDIVVGYEQESDFQEYSMSGRVTDPPERTGPGWTLHYSGSGAVYNPDILLMASTVESAPEDADVVPIGDVEDETLRSTLESAAETGESQQRVSVGGAEIDAYLQRLASLSADFDLPEDRGDSDTLYADVDGTVVELEATVSSLHGDYWWDAWYYVDDHVVRRTDDEETDPRNGTLVECRESA